jgi:hypothetical protein
MIVPIFINVRRVFFFHNGLTFFLIDSIHLFRMHDYTGLPGDAAILRNGRWENYSSRSDVFPVGDRKSHSEPSQKGSTITEFLLITKKSKLVDRFWRHTGIWTELTTSSSVPDCKRAQPRCLTQTAIFSARSSDDGSETHFSSKNRSHPPRLSTILS